MPPFSLSLSLYSADSLFPHPASSQLHLPPPILQYMRLSFFSILALPLYVSSYFLLLPFGLTSQLLCVLFSLSTWPTFSPLSFFPSPSPSSLSSCLRENTQFFLKTGVWFWAHSRNIIFGIKSSSRLVSQCLPPHPPKKDAAGQAGCACLFTSLSRLPVIPQHPHHWAGLSLKAKIKRIKNKKWTGVFKKQSMNNAFRSCRKSSCPWSNTLCCIFCDQVVQFTF